MRLEERILLKLYVAHFTTSRLRILSLYMILSALELSLVLTYL